MAGSSMVAGPSRGPDTWRPSRYLEPNHPDNEEVHEQAAYQAAVTRMTSDQRAKRYKPRRTVDYQGGMLKWRLLAKTKGVDGYLPPIHSSPSDIIGLLPPEAHRTNSSTSICDNFVHTSINKERSPTRVVKWTSDARRLLTGNDKGQFTLWNGASFNYESITQVHDDSIRDFKYSHNGQNLVSVDKLGMIKYFTPHLTNIHGFQGHREACHGLAWSPNDERFVSGGDDGLVKIWDYREAKEEKILSGHGWDVRCVDWHPSKGLVVSGSKDMLVKFWDPRTGRDLSTLHSHKAVVNACNWNPNGHVVATAGGDGVIRMFDIRTFREMDVMKTQAKEVHCLEWHPVHTNLLVSGDSSGGIAYWSLLSPDISEPLTVMEAAHDDAVFSLNFHPLGHILCSGSKDFTTRFWSRARPQGGQELDKWHIGEEKAMGARMQIEQERSKWPTPKEDEGSLPGLPGLGQSNGAGPEIKAEDRATSPSFSNRSVPGLDGSSLPGFGAASGSAVPPPRPNNYGGPPQGPPMRSWGADPMMANAQGRQPPGDYGRGDGGPRGGYRGAPLPPQGQMTGYGQAPPPQDGYGGPPPPPGGYGRGVNDQGYRPQGGYQGEMGHRQRQGPPQGYGNQGQGGYSQGGNGGGRQWR